METKQGTILVVDDDALVAEMLALILGEAGHRVELAGDGRAALRKLEEVPEIRLVVSDMNMPQMDGLQLIEAIRGGNSQVPVIILTGNSEISLAIAALDKGASAYLLKDDNIQETLAVSVAQVLEKDLLQRRNRQLMEDLALKNRQLEEELALAQKVQQNILPKDLAIPGFETASYYRPSNRIGGDFFDAFETEGQVHFLIGDISGHSTSSALVMAVCKGMFLSLGQSRRDPLDLVTTANRMLCGMLQQSGMFLTLLYACHDKGTGLLSLVSAGHNPSYLLSGGKIAEVESGGPVLGWDEEDSWEVVTLPFEPGALLFLYTDGLVEAKDRQGRQFGDLLLEKLALCDRSPQLVVGRMLDELASFSPGPLEDDLTLFAVKRTL